MNEHPQNGQEAWEEDLRQREERLRLALEAGHMGTWDWNIQTKELNWSPGLESIHGLLPGTKITFQDYVASVHPDDRDAVILAGSE